MKRGQDLMARAVPEYREITSSEGAAAATRARILTGFEQHRRWRARAHRLWTALTVTAAVVGSAALAAARIAHWTPQPVVLRAGDESAATAPREPHRPRRIIPVAEPAASDAEPDPRIELRLYGAAHAAHFAAHDPSRALAAWNAYLDRYPHGSFEPEARFNRAICLVRLRQPQAAASALAPFLAGRFGTYRRDEAQRLFDWLSQPALSDAPAR
jgi:TolA-binding protein